MPAPLYSDLGGVSDHQSPGMNILQVTGFMNPSATKTLYTTQILLNCEHGDFADHVSWTKWSTVRSPPRSRFFSKWLRSDFKIENCQICPLRDLNTRSLFYENGDASDSDSSLLVKASLKGAIVIKLGTV